MRGQEHKYQLKLFKEGKKGGKESVMGRHIKEFHNSQFDDVSWDMKVWSHHLGQTHGRQVREKVLIDEFGTINTRGEMGTDFISQARDTRTRSPTRGLAGRGRSDQQ